MTTISQFINDLSSLRAIDKEKNITINGQAIQSISIKEYKTEKVFPIKDNDGQQVFKKDEDDNIILDGNGEPIPDMDIETHYSYKAHFTTGKQNDDYATVTKLMNALQTLSTVEKMGSVVFGEDDIFIVGKDYTYADRVNIDTDATINDITKL